jgi:hypothetical protein
VPAAAGVSRRDRIASGIRTLQLWAILRRIVWAIQDESTHKEDTLMAWPIVDAVLGLLIAAACIGLPQWVRKRRQRPDDDTQAYLKEVGRSARDIAHGNAAELQQENEARSRQASGSDGPPLHGAPGGS